MRPIVTFLVTFCLVCLCVDHRVCLLVKTVNPAKTDEPIEIPFWMWTGISPRNYILYEDPDRHTSMGNFKDFWLTEIHWDCLLLPTALLQTGRCHVKFSSTKSPPCVAVCFQITLGNHATALTINPRAYILNCRRVLTILRVIARTSTRKHCLYSVHNLRQTTR